MAGFGDWEGWMHSSGPDEVAVQNGMCVPVPGADREVIIIYGHGE